MARKKIKFAESVLLEEIIKYKILPRVPLKSLIRFKVVCQDWNKLISSDVFFKASQYQRSLEVPHAIMMHEKRNKKLSLFSTEGDKYSVGTLSLNYIFAPSSDSSFNFHFHEVYASSNGILCGLYRNFVRVFFYLTNPITKEWIFLPKPEVYAAVGLDFDPSSGYTIVCPYISERIDDQVEIGFKVSSSQNVGAWSNSNANVYICRSEFSLESSSRTSRSVFIGGKFYWKLFKDVLWFDVKGDNAGIVAAPDGVHDQPFEIGNDNGELSYTKITWMTVDIWVLRNKDNEFIWDKKHSLSLKEIVENNNNNNNALKIGKKRPIPLPFEGGDVVVLSFKVRGYWKISSYNISTRNLKVINKLGKLEFTPDLYSFRSNFVSVRTSV